MSEILHIEEKGIIKSIWKQVIKHTLPIKNEVDKLVEDSFLLGCLKADPSEMVDIVIKKGEKVIKPAKKNNFFFRQFSNNEINSEDYIRLTNDKELEMSCAGGQIEDVKFFHGKLKNINLDKNEIGILPSVSYPDRTHFKKKENLLSKVVKWWKK